MSEIKIPFNDWSKARLRKGTKIATSRNKRYGNIDDNFTVDDMQFVIVDVFKTPLYDVAYRLYKQEGATSPEEFIEVWNEIHPIKKYQSEQRVYFHQFRKIN